MLQLQAHAAVRRRLVGECSAAVEKVLRGEDARALEKEDTAQGEELGKAGIAALGLERGAEVTGGADRGGVEGGVEGVPLEEVLFCRYLFCILLLK